MASSHSQGGLELSTAQIGIINGTVGVIALLLGGILGGVVISKGGLKKWLWPMAFSLTLPCGFYCLLAMTQPTNFILIQLLFLLSSLDMDSDFLPTCYS